MRAAILRSAGAEPQLGEFDEPVAGDGQAVLDVSVAGVNPIDIRLASGQLGPPRVPSIVGLESVGTLADGRRVYCGSSISPYGSWAPRTLIDPERAFPVADGLDDALAVALGISGIAAWLALEHDAKVRRGESVLVLGATGTVGLIAVQAAKLLGAKRVVAAGRNAERLKRAAELGADATVSLEEGDLAAAFKEAAGGDGPTHIVDTLWGAPAVAAIQAAAPGWRLVQVGQSAGAEATVASAVIRGKMGELYGYTDFAVPKDVFSEQYLRLVGHAVAEEIVFDIETYPLERVAEAWERQVNGANAKIVVTLT
jgi:NADPH2:quinone reductase